MAGIFDSIPIITVVLFALGLVGVIVYERSRSNDKIKPNSWFLIWKIWFFLAIWLTLTIAFATFLKETIATILATVLAAWRIWKPNVYVHNFTELFVYAGILWLHVGIYRARFSQHWSGEALEQTSVRT